jgi:hypothetical protein
VHAGCAAVRNDRLVNDFFDLMNRGVHLGLARVGLTRLACGLLSVTRETAKNRNHQAAKESETEIGHWN